MMYLLRSWPDISYDTLCSLNNQSLAFSLDKDLVSATVVSTTSESGFAVGQKLSYKELLSVLVRERQIITL